ncbi:S66 family peptidase [Liquorilactobacillus mali]|uniref:Carboxypeptidase n=1 Tax=Liquorilactobacillus mali KCTC 3596 = DSM 20444 TaxID=1046596 RepID=A0A0R2E4K0_9LACO|nr:S66 peptidase family protein [Liquorilactobacillus mali]KRN10518.1 carboxypeptidase [Liquorilactobacillus mali KCTC 3596 = DSM 20444]MDC7951884.1 LD-carboxypeptidase [Liquorilactobacillus mali]QFQ75065.1 LD-carboxypeptidase [Liquorilactobacillus mali]
MILVKPHTLKTGDKVAIVSLSSGVLGEDFVKHQKELGEKRLRNFGLEPVYMTNALMGIEYLQNHPEARAADLKEAFLRTDIQGIFCVIGGDDTYRLLPYLLDDQEFVTAVHDHPKLFSGFSDTTINHLMFYKLGLQTFYGPNFLNDLAELDENLLPYTANTISSYFKNTPNLKIVSSDTWYEERTTFSPEEIGTARISHPEKRGYETLNGGGIVTGRLLGGCIDSLNDILTSSRYTDEREICFKYGIFPELKQWEDKLLFIETSEERPAPDEYEAMLSNLEQRGIFGVIKAIIVGKPQNNVYYQEYREKLKNIAAKYRLPVLMNVNFGHAYPRTVIPYGCMAKIDFDKKSFEITEPLFQE